jgi:TM2 domain-containing membrane protein YozV
MIIGHPITGLAEVAFLTTVIFIFSLLGWSRHVPANLVSGYRFASEPSSMIIGHPITGLAEVAFLTTVIFIFVS